MKDLFRFDIDDVLGLVRLERRRPLLKWGVSVGMFALGAGVGAGLGLALAPSSGRSLRHGVGERIDQIRRRAATEPAKAAATVNAVTPPG